jgi:exodeoxyribonuclease VII large subunit
MAAVGLGDLLARIERLKEALYAEGLFSPQSKVPLPFIPRRVGLICANQGDAEHDVVENATRRWPAVQFEIRRVSVQGARCVTETMAALADLDSIPQVDVIVVARGGGSFEDLLPFSDEKLVRAAAAVVTPLVSAIGHEKDSPLLDLVADYRASTPTDAGKRIVPDAAVELAVVLQSRSRMAEAMGRRVDREAERLERQWHQLKVGLVATMTSAEAQLRELRAGLRAMSPQAVLERGYAVVRTAHGEVVRSAHQVRAKEKVTLTFASGAAVATVNEVSTAAD